MTDINDEINEHFEAQRIHDLKIDVDAVLEELKKDTEPKTCDGEAYPDCASCRMYRLSEDLKWYKELL